MSKPTSEETWLAGLIAPSRLLLVDDNEADVLIFTQHLNGWNVDLSVARSGEEALQLFFPGKFLAAFLDLNLPGLSGSEVFKSIRKRDRETPIVILSGYIDSKIERDLPQYGRVTLMKKAEYDIGSYLKSIGAHRIGTGSTPPPFAKNESP